MISEADFLADIPVVLSPSRLVQPQADSPSAVTVIDRDMIRAAGITQVFDVFRLVPGFSVARQDGLIGTLSYHGLGDGASRRFQVLIDGRSAYSPDFGQVFWRNLPLSLEDIERIEVIRGPASASYGANAFLGVINILTRSGADSTHAGVMASVGERNYREWGARVGGEGEAGSWRVSAGQHADDYYAKAADAVRDRYADLRGDWRLSTVDTLTLQAGVSNAKEAVDLANGRPFPVNQHSTHGQISWQHVHNSGAETRLAYNLSQQSVGDTVDLGTATPLDIGFRLVGRI
ncbi:MAG: TonB-dependent receptor plug domain-containing protein [Thiobacillaceae bacterium]